MVNLIASDKSYEVLQRRRRLGEIGLPPLHLNPQALQLLAQRAVVREATPAEPIRGIDFETWERIRLQQRIER